MKGVRIDMQHHIVEGKAKFHGFGRAVENAGVAVPTLFGVGYLGNRTFFMFKYVHGTNGCAHAAVGALFGMNDGRHDNLLNKGIPRIKL